MNGTTLGVTHVAVGRIDDDASLDLAFSTRAQG